MKPKTRHALILVLVVILIGVAVYYIVPPGEKTHLGLDLRGGLEVVYEAKTTQGKVPTADQMDKTLSIIDRRVNGLGVSESAVQKQGQDQISVSLPGITDVEEALAVVGKTAQLEFYDDGETRIAGPATSRKELWQQAGGTVPDKVLKKLKALGKAEQPDKYRIITAAKGMWGDNKVPLYFLYKHKPAMTGAAIKEARQSFDQLNKPNVLMDFTEVGGKQFEEVTKQLAVRGALKQEPQTFAIVLDNAMESDPQVDYQDNPQGISGGSAEITGNFTIDEAKNLALVLNTGALPVTLTAIEKQEVSATLGADSLKAGLIAGIVGMGLVLILMVAVYRFLGVIADLALVIYAILLWGVFNAVPVTLTLPGIAGMILTIGVAADANVVVFERIKEEVRRGKSVRSAINSGYGKGFKTILDANILIIITAVVIFYFATAQPKGFALTLIIGTLVSLFTAVLATRAMLGLLSDFSWFNKASFMGAKPGEQIFDGEFSWDADAAKGGRRGAAARRPRTSASRRPAAATAGGDGRGSVAGAEPRGSEPVPAAPEAPEAVVDAEVEPAAGDTAAAAPKPRAKRTGGKGKRQPPRKKKRR